MTDDFLSKGLEQDRYLKAIRLTDQFETSIEGRLRQVGQEMRARKPELFASDDAGSENTGRDSSSSLAFARIDYPLSRVRDQGSNKQLKLNVHLYWVKPEQYNRDDIEEGALRGFGYKIKTASSEDEQRVKEQTRDWDLETAQDPFGYRVIFYKHVSSIADIEDTSETLVEHFGEFGDEFGVPMQS
ncbi:hypothetical protein [Haloglomus litoreum]|uniref:hypothetical protein n=1 Tax=Haloglomus litoreum TaxID=3034026 RepID=UPI0023E85492|nr:hypothetical protein [Haloglomus sp. DT116]